MYNNRVSKNKCILPWISLSIGTDGQIAPCCQALPASDAEFLAESKDPLHSPNLVRLREEFLNGKIPKDCQQCFELEKSNGISMRMLKNKEYEEFFINNEQTKESPSLVEFDVRLSNACQLSCLTCEPLFSSSWYSHNADDKISKVGKILKSFESEDHINRFMDEYSSSIKLYTFSGGEPFIDPLLNKFLSKLDPNTQEVNFNTGLSVSKNLLEKHLISLSHLKKVKLAVSLDAIGDQAEKMRRGLRWNDFLENLSLVNSILGPESIYFQFTCSNLNAGMLSEVLIWISENYPDSLGRTTVNFVHSPEQYNPRNASPEQKASWVETNNLLLKNKLFSTLKEKDFNFSVKLINLVHSFFDNKN